MPITYEKRRENAIRKAVEILKPAFLEYLWSSDSAHVDPTVAQPVAHAVRKYFLGLKQSKGEAVQKLRLTPNEMDRAIYTTIRELLTSAELVDHLSKKNKEQKEEKARAPRFNPWGEEKTTKTPTGLRHTLLRARPKVRKRRWSRT